MYTFDLSKIGLLAISAATVLSLAACVEEAAIQPPNADAPIAATKIISPNVASFSNPSVATDRTAKEYYIDLEKCRSHVASGMGNTGADDLDALRRALKNPTSGSKVIVRYGATDRAVVRDRAVKTCLASKGYAIKL